MASTAAKDDPFPAFFFQLQQRISGNEEQPCENTPESADSWILESLLKEHKEEHRGKLQLDLCRAYQEQLQLDRTPVPLSKLSRSLLQLTRSLATGSLQMSRQALDTFLMTLASVSWQRMQKAARPARVKVLEDGLKMLQALFVTSHEVTIRRDWAWSKLLLPLTHEADLWPRIRTSPPCQLSSVPEFQTEMSLPQPLVMTRPSCGRTAQSGTHEIIVREHLDILEISLPVPIEDDRPKAPWLHSQTVMHKSDLLREERADIHEPTRIDSPTSSHEVIIKNEDMITVHETHSSATGCISYAEHDVTLRIPVRDAYDCIRWLSCHTYFGRVISISLTADNKCAIVGLESTRSAYMYNGLLRFAGAAIPGFKDHFSVCDMVGIKLKNTVAMQDQRSRVILFNCRHSPGVVNRLHHSFNIDPELRNMTLTTPITNSLLCACFPSIEVAATVMDDFTWRNRRFSDLGISHCEYGPDPSCLEFEMVWPATIPVTECYESILQRKMSQVLWPHRYTEIPQPLSVRIAKLSNADRIEACECFSLIQDPSIRRKFRREVLEAQRTEAGQIELTKHGQTSGCTCGMQGSRRGRGRNSYFLPYAPVVCHETAIAHVHVRNASHANVEATVSRVDQLAHLGALKRQELSARVKRYIESCPACGIRTSTEIGLAKHLKRGADLEGQSRKRTAEHCWEHDRFPMSNRKLQKRMSSVSLNRESR